MYFSCNIIVTWETANSSFILVIVGVKILSLNFVLVMVISLCADVHIALFMVLCSAQFCNCKICRKLGFFSLIFTKDNLLEFFYLLLLSFMMICYFPVILYTFWVLEVFGSFFYVSCCFQICVMYYKIWDYNGFYVCRAGPNLTP